MYKQGKKYDKNQGCTYNIFIQDTGELCFSALQRTWQLKCTYNT